MANRTVESCLRLDAMTLKEDIVELLNSPYTGMSAGSSEMTYSIDRDRAGHLRAELSVRWQHLAPKVIGYADLESTTPTYGGKRWWFRCPGCARRCRVLYIPRGGARFGCRLCLQLAYATQHVNQFTRQIWKIERIKQRTTATTSGRKRHERMIRGLPSLSFPWS
jgi:hypothetical protein